MSDLIERLRQEPTWYEKKHGLPRPAMEVWHETALEAADEIERLNERIAKLEAVAQADKIRLADMEATCEFLHETEADNERLTAELNNERARGIHSCGPHCQRMECTQGRRIAKLEAELQHFYDYGYDRGRCEEALKEEK